MTSIATGKQRYGSTHCVVSSNLNHVHLHRYQTCNRLIHLAVSAFAFIFSDTCTIISVICNLNVSGPLNTHFVFMLHGAFHSYPLPSPHIQFAFAGGNPSSCLTAVDEVRHYVTESERVRQAALTSFSTDSSNKRGTAKQAGRQGPHPIFMTLL